jgi:hypothetical protein
MINFGVFAILIIRTINYVNMITDNQTNKIYFSPALERDCQSHMLTDTLLLLKLEIKWQEKMKKEWICLEVKGKHRIFAA